MPLHARQQSFAVVQHQAERIEHRMGIGAATASDVVDLLRSIGAAQFDCHTPFRSRPLIFRAATVAPPCLGRSLAHNLRDRRAVARYAGLTGAPDESGSKRREKGLAKTGNARVRRGMIQLAWRFLLFQKDSALAQWFRTRTEGASGVRKTKMIVALARKLLIALWRMVTTGEVPHGVVLRQAG
jgi:hypothetical protein